MKILFLMFLWAAAAAAQARDIESHNISTFQRYDCMTLPYNYLQEISDFEELQRRLKRASETEKPDVIDELKLKSERLKVLADSKFTSPSLLVRVDWSIDRDSVESPDPEWVELAERLHGEGTNALSPEEKVRYKTGPLDRIISKRVLGAVYIGVPDSSVTNNLTKSDFFEKIGLTEFGEILEKPVIRYNFTARLSLIERCQLLPSLAFHLQYTNRRVFFGVPKIVTEDLILKVNSQ